MRSLYIVPIEPIDQRYTKQWYENLPKLIGKRIEQKGNQPWHVVTIDGRQPKMGTTAGAFLDFGVTNIYKASQVEDIAGRFSRGEIKPGDKFLVTDAWNFVVTAIRYMSDLLDIPVEIHGIWHAGAYDPTDILGMKMGKAWSAEQERAWFYACDYNYFATDFHKDMFLKNLNISAEGHAKALRSGQPHTQIIDFFAKRSPVAKRGIILWPHRYNADKQPEIAEDLIKDHKMLITQKFGLQKEQYYEAMEEASIIFSCALHENLGISVMEGTLAGAIPLVPDRASYSEMYFDEFKYPSEWTASYEAFLTNRDNLTAYIKDRIENRDKYLPLLEKQKQRLIQDYLNADIMIDKILEL